MQPEWFKVKRYPHIGVPIAKSDARRVVSYITKPENIAHHQFLPLIRREVVSYPHRRIANNGCKRRKGKKRLLSFAAHLDANIYSYYADRLQKRYEEFITEKGLDDVVVAYRKIQCADGHGNKSNIHIANDVFCYAKTLIREGREVAIVTFDIKGFFDNLDHRILKRTWKQIMGFVDMPSDEYTVFRNVTHYSYVEERALYELYKDRILCRKNGSIVKRLVKDPRHMRKHEAVAFCTTDGMREIKQHRLLQIHIESKGIPQGLPISAVLANIYMKDFDVTVNQYVQSIGGIYKRYSDDIIIVCPIPSAKEVKHFVMGIIQKQALEIEERKTNLFEIHIIHGKPVCVHESEGKNKPVEYLGFSFDGQRILLKDASLCRYYYKMDRDKRRHKKWTIGVNNDTNGRVFTSQIVRRFTLAGARRHHKLLRQVGGTFVQLPEKSYGNFLTYAYKSAAIMNEPAIRKQLRHNLYKVKSNIAEIKGDYLRVQRAKLIAQFNLNKN